MTYDRFFADAIARLRDERRYLERIAGRFPHAIWYSPEGPRNVVIWCSNDISAWASIRRLLAQ
jgi:5-aminolevulinate synthase